MNRLLPLLLILALASCVGTRARDEALMPVASQIWPNVRIDYEAGLADGVADGDLNNAQRGELLALADDLGEALESGSRSELLSVPWDTQMRPWAIRGITAAVDAGELGPNGSQILYQRVANFTAVILTLQERLGLISSARWDRSTVPSPNPYIITPPERRVLAALED